MTPWALWRALHQTTRPSVWGTATELQSLCSIFFLHQADQSSLPKVWTLKQPGWCERSIKLTTPWIVVKKGNVKIRKPDRKSWDLHWNSHYNLQQYHFKTGISCHSTDNMHSFCCPVRYTKRFYDWNDSWDKSKKDVTDTYKDTGSTLPHDYSQYY